MNTIISTGVKICFLTILVIFSALAAYIWFAPHPFVSAEEAACPSKYPECTGMPAPAMPGWDVPTDLHEKKMYDLAHSLRVPDVVAKVVPFDFRSARIKDINGDKPVAQQYFEHLCATESREYVFRSILNVDGFQIMRPRPPTIGTPEDKDRFGAEEPLGFGGYNDDDQLNPKSFVGGNYVQPLNGFYSFVEYIDPEKPNEVVRLERASSPVDPKNYRYGVIANWRSPGGGPIRVPLLKTWRHIESVTARYGYIWRGLRRSRDREFGIAGGEFFIFDLQTHEVLGFRRSFNSTYVPSVPLATKWSAARECQSRSTELPIPNFIKRVLHVDMHVNDKYVPSEYLNEYHKYMQRIMETGYAH